MRESEYQASLKKKLEALLPGCLILKNDSSYLQGIPDFLILFEDRWAMLEVKASANAPTQPNQIWYVNRLNNMSFAAFIFPSNEQDVLGALQQALLPDGHARFPERE